MDKAEDRIKKLETENKSMFFEIIGIIHFVDKWLDGKELELNNVQRADIAREKALKIIEDLQKQIPKEGRWVTIPCNFGLRCRYICNRCEYHSEHKYTFCPSCGAKMKGD